MQEWPARGLAGSSSGSATLRCRQSTIHLDRDHLTEFSKSPFLLLRLLLLLPPSSRIGAVPRTEDIDDTTQHDNRQGESAILEFQFCGERPGEGSRRESVATVPLGEAIPQSQSQAKAGEDSSLVAIPPIPILVSICSAAAVRLRCDVMQCWLDLSPGGCV